MVKINKAEILGQILKELKETTIITKEKFRIPLQTKHPIKEIAELNRKRREEDEKEKKKGEKDFRESDVDYADPKLREIQEREQKRHQDRYKRTGFKV